MFVVQVVYACCLKNKPRIEEDHAGQHALQHACVHTLTRRIQDKVVHGDWRYPVVESLQENHAGVNRINKCPFD